MTRLTGLLMLTCVFATACAVDDPCAGDEGCAEETMIEQELGSTVAVATLPYFESFDDNSAPELISRSMYGTSPAWSIRTYGANSRLLGHANKAVSIATINTAGLPPGFRLSARIAYPLMDVIDWLEARYPGEGYLVFDYKSKTDFKYARIVVSRWGSTLTYTYKCVIGKFVGSTDTPLAVTPACRIVNHNTGPTDYHAAVEVDGSSVRLLIDGQPMVSYTFPTAFTGVTGVGAATDGGRILRTTAGTSWVRSKFDDLALEPLVP